MSSEKASFVQLSSKGPEVDESDLYTPGPWKWFGNTDSHINLATNYGGRIFVLQPHGETKKWCENCEGDGYCYDTDLNDDESKCIDCEGNGYTTPENVNVVETLRFQVGHRMVDHTEMVKYEVLGYKTLKEVSNPNLYRKDFCGIDHPDARVIEAAPEMLELLREFDNADGMTVEDVQTKVMKFLETMPLPNMKLKDGKIH